MIVQVNYDSQTRLVSALMEMLDSEELCNFIIKAGTQSLKAHKCVLAAALGYFRTSFHFSEESSAKTSIDLSHLNCNITHVQRVVRSLYSNEIDLDMEHIEGILRLADYLLHRDLTVCVERFMENTLGLNNVIFYFKLCIQYDLRSTSLFANIRRILRGRFHDFLIHEPSTLKLEMEILASMQSFDLLDNCTPLQMMSFLLKKLLQDSLSRSIKEEEDLIYIVDFLQNVLPRGDDPSTKLWNSYLRDHLNEWLSIHCQHFVQYNSLVNKLKCLSNKLSDGLKTSQPIKCSKNDLTIDTNQQGESSSSLLIEDTEKQNVSVLTSNSTHADNPSNKSLKSDEPSSISCHPSSTSQTETVSGSQTPMQAGNSDHRSSSPQETSSSPSRLKTSAENIPSPMQTFPTGHQKKDDLCPVLVVLAPSSDMASQLLEVEGGKIRPLLRSPKLCLHLYDIQLSMWKEHILLDFPVPGYMLEKHSWRVAFANGNLYLFSLVKKMGLEYNLSASTWAHLSCEELFKAHTNGYDNEFAVKSIIPISVANELVVLSMSREPRPDGSFITQQHIYQFDQDNKTFSHVTAVHDQRMDLPITKWTVKDDELFTLKASTVMYRDLHVYNVQHIHVYNARSRRLVKSHHVQSAMKSGLKVMVQSGKLYLLNNLGEYQELDLATSNLSGWRVISNRAFTTVNSSVTDGSEIYPALLRTTCHAGSSRWTVSALDNIGSASLQEMYVSEGGEFGIAYHPSPPFLHLTAMCQAQVARGILDAMEQARFDPSLSLQKYGALSILNAGFLTQAIAGDVKPCQEMGLEYINLGTPAMPGALQIIR